MGLTSRRGRAPRLSERCRSSRTIESADFILELHAGYLYGIRDSPNGLFVALGHEFDVEERGLDRDPSGREFRIGMDVDVIVPTKDVQFENEEDEINLLRIIGYIKAPAYRIDEGSCRQSSV